EETGEVAAGCVDRVNRLSLARVQARSGPRRDTVDRPRALDEASSLEPSQGIAGIDARRLEGASIGAGFAEPGKVSRQFPLSHGARRQGLENALDRRREPVAALARRRRLATPDPRRHGCLKYFAERVLVVVRRPAQKV